MDLSTITPQMFREHFLFDFPYLNIYSDTKLYNTAARVYYPTTELFYDSLVDGNMGNLPTDTDFWVKVADSVENYISDAQILRAMQEAKQVFNQALWGSDEGITLGFLYCTAHFLVIDTRAQMAGISGNGNYPVSSRSVGSVSESYAIPTQFNDDALLGMYNQTSYGNKYLQMILPLLRGNVVPVCGRTLP